MSPKANKLISLMDLEALKGAGIPWKNINAVRWAYRKRKENGLADAFVTIGRNCFVDPDKFHECVRRESPVIQPMAGSTPVLPRRDTILKAIRFHSEQITELLEILEKDRS